MKIWCISDTHSYHNLLTVPKNIDMILFAGDATSSPKIYQNLPEMYNFLEWFKNLPIKYKIFVPGNHDVSCAHKAIVKGDLEMMGITYLEHDETEIEGIRIFGSPYTPDFNPQTWVYNCKRSKIDRYWKQIPEDTDILVTHGPAKYFLDTTDCLDTKKLINVGCKALNTRIQRLPLLKMHVFGHIHDNFSKCGECHNSGVLIGPDNIVRVNASCVTDREFGQLSSNGYIVDYNNNKITIGT